MAPAPPGKFAEAPWGAAPVGTTTEAPPTAGGSCKPGAFVSPFAGFQASLSSRKPVTKSVYPPPGFRQGLPGGFGVIGCEAGSVYGQACCHVVCLSVRSIHFGYTLSRGQSFACHGCCRPSHSMHAQGLGFGLMVLCHRVYGGG
jgi:hypothetical protein